MDASTGSAILSRLLYVGGRQLEATVFQACSEEHPGANTTVLLECISDQLQQQQHDGKGVNDEVWNSDVLSFLLTLSGALIFFMQTGFAMLCAGCVRLKNVQNTMMKNLLDACGAAVAFFLIGYSIAYGGQYTTSGTTFVGSGDWFATGPSPSYWFFEYAFSATAVTIVAGTLAERCQMTAYLCYSVVLSGVIYPIVAHQIWSRNGFLCVDNLDGAFLGQGAIDFAGSGVVHLTGGATALYATKILGPRRGRFYNEHGEPLERPKPFPGHSVSLQLLGLLVLWFGWYGFNAGSALNLPINERGLVAANAAVATTLSASGGGISALFTNLFLEERRTGEYHFVMLVAINGCLSGLVAITSGCSVVEPWGALVIGIVAGWVYIVSSKLLERLRIDDAVNAVPVHMFSGSWGLLATGLLASPRRLELTYGSADHVGLFYSFARDDKPDFVLLACQVVALLLILGWTFCTMVPFFLWLNYRGWFRSDSYEELIGLDISYHGGGGIGKSMTVDDGVGVKFIDERRKEAREEKGRPHAHAQSHDQSPGPTTSSIEVEIGSGKSSNETYPLQLEDPYAYEVPDVDDSVQQPQLTQEEHVHDQYDCPPHPIPQTMMYGPRHYYVESMEDFSSSYEHGVERHIRPLPPSMPPPGFRDDAVDGACGNYGIATSDVDFYSYSHQDIYNTNPPAADPQSYEP